MNFITNLVNFCTNSILGFVLIGIIALAGLSVYSLSPVSYESTLENEQVLGVSDQVVKIGNDTMEVKDNNFKVELKNKTQKFEDLFQLSNNYTINSFIGKTGYIAKIEINEVLKDFLYLDLVSVSNITDSQITYDIKISVDNEISEYLEMLVYIDGIKSEATFNEEGEYSSQIKLKDLISSDISLQVIDIRNYYKDIELQIELIEKSDISKLP